MHPTLPILVLAFIASPLPAAPKISGPLEVRPGGFAQLTIEGAGKTVIWSITPEPIQDAEIAGTLVFTGRPGMDYTATAIIIDFGAKSVEKLKHTVRFLGDVPVPPPVPPPDPGPPPPLPLDPLAKSIKAAAASSGWTYRQLTDYAIGFRACANLAATWQKTAGALQSAAASTLRSSLTDLGTGKLTPVPKAVADVIDGELATLDTLLPKTAPDKLLTDGERAAVQAVFNKIAAAIEGAAK